MAGILILSLAVVAAVGFGLYRRHVDGRFTDRPTDELTTWSEVAAALPAEQPGERATLLQFSSAFCAPCRTTRVVLSDIAARESGVRHVEVDAEKHLELVRALGVRRTPTTLVLDAAGRELVRAAGVPRKEQVLAVLPEPAR